MQVEHCWPGDQQKPESIWLNPTEGIEANVPVFHGPASANNPITLDDKFTIPIEIMVQNPGSTPVTAEARLGELYRAVIATIAADPGLASISAPTGWYVFAAVVGAIEGPGTARGREGAQSYASVVIHVHARKS